MEKVNNGLYNMLFGENDHASELLEILNLDRTMFGRYRDCFLNSDGTIIIVLTRCGGNNRTDYDNVFVRMREHERYMGDADDPSDETYCYFEFEVPVLFRPQTRPLATGKPFQTIGQKFQEEAKLLKKGDPGAVKRANMIAQSIGQQIEDKPHGGVIFMGDPDWKFTKKED